jgi:hypothetical protein
MIIFILGILIFLFIIYIYYRTKKTPQPMSVNNISELDKLKQLYINDELYYARIHVIENTKTIEELEAYIRDKGRSIPCEKNIEIARHDYNEVRQYISGRFRMERAINYSNLRRLLAQIKKIDVAELHPIICGIMEDSSGREYCANTLNFVLSRHVLDQPA